MEIRRDETPEQVRSMSQYDAADHLLSLRSPVERVEQGLDWIVGNGHPLSKSLTVATIVLSNIPQVLAELKSLKAQQTAKPESSAPQT